MVSIGNGTVSSNQWLTSMLTARPIELVAGKTGESFTPRRNHDCLVHTFIYLYKIIIHIKYTCSLICILYGICISLLLI